MGCGGNGGGGNEPPNSLAGNWSGTWGSWNGSEPPPGDTGQLNLTISESGEITGTSHNDGYAETGPVTGTVTPEGYIQLNIDYPSHDVEAHGALGTDLTGGCMFNTEERRTIHGYVTLITLDRQ